MEMMDHLMAEKNNQKNKDSHMGQVTPKKYFKNLCNTGLAQHLGYQYLCWFHTLF
jgi:hypothetical protein